jgi:hypothetical protein
MGVSGQRPVLDALYPQGKNPGTHCTGGWVDPGAVLDTEVRGKILCRYRGSNLTLHGQIKNVQTYNVLL